MLNVLGGGSGMLYFSPKPRKLLTRIVKMGSQLMCCTGDIKAAWDEDDRRL